MKYIYLFLGVLFANILSSQSVITIGTGNINATGVNYNPIYRSSAASSFDFSRAFYLFDAAELAAAGLPAGATITQIEWYKSNNGATVSSTANINFGIYMNNSALSSYATAQTWTVLNNPATVVYTNNTQAIPATIGWLPFTLTTPFVYNGAALEISTDWDVSAVSGNPTTAGFSFSNTAVANHVGGTSAGTALAPTVLMTVQANRPNIRITYTPPPACSGAPNSGTANISIASGCPNLPFNLSATGLSAASGLIYQWYSSPSASGPWSAITNATNTAYSTATSVTTYYQMETTCTVSAMTATTSVTSYSVVNPGPCVCGTYPGSSANFTGDEEVLNVTFGTLNNNSTCASVGPGPGSILNRYSNYSGFVAAPTVVQGQSVPFSINVGTCGGNFDSGISIFIDYNQNGVFTDAGEQAYLSTASINGPYIQTGNITIPLTASVGVTRMRVVNMETTVMSSIVSDATYGYGETEDYCIDIILTTACSGVPNSGVAAISTPTGCPNTNFNLSATGLSSAGGITYQWYSSPSASGPWNAITNATNTTHSSNTTTTTYYQLVTTCSVSALSATTSIVSFSVVNPGPCICAGHLLVQHVCVL
ncbi:MAG: hypothetical protein IPG08_02510 [Sphingobacteriaceae bacterium]|nr:hypothetical protein [Sphingobacteriaceae bacterium]